MGLDPHIYGEIMHCRCCCYGSMKVSYDFFLVVRRGEGGETALIYWRGRPYPP